MPGQSGHGSSTQPHCSQLLEQWLEGHKTQRQTLRASSKRIRPAGQCTSSKKDTKQRLAGRASAAAWREPGGARELRHKELSTVSDHKLCDLIYES